MIRVMIVDDQAVVCRRTRILGPDDGFEVVAECEDGDEVVARVTDHHPDLVLMDIRMRRVDGVSAIQALVDAGDPPPVLVLTTFDDDDDARCGALSTPAPPGSSSRTPRPRLSSRPLGRSPAARRGSMPTSPPVCSMRSGRTSGREWPKRLAPTC